MIKLYNELTLYTILFIMQRDLLDFLLSEFREKPGMYLGSYSLSKLPTFVAGFMIASHFYDQSKSSLNRFSNFHDWFEKKYSLERSSSWTLPFLEMTNHDETAALNLFFSELDQFVSETNAKN